MKYLLTTNFRSRLKARYVKFSSDEYIQKRFIFLKVIFLFVFHSLFLRRSTSLENVRSFKVCLFSGDVYGGKGAGGTATAYFSMAQSLTKAGFSVRFVALTRSIKQCELLKELYNSSGVILECLGDFNFLVDTTPYDALGYAALIWARNNENLCDMIHSHEWGGFLASLAVFNQVFPLKALPKIVIVPHGGHMWSSLGRSKRPNDIEALRIDEAERILLHMSDIVVSPFRYMKAHLQQRGWNLPHVQVIPNNLENLDRSKFIPALQRPSKICFFSQLEERKGLKIFVDAVSSLTGSLTPETEIVFLGSDGITDGSRSSVWLKNVTKFWPFITHVRTTESHEQALKIIHNGEYLIALPSIMENSPYVLLEVANMRLPFVTFDSGGVTEVVDSTPQIVQTSASRLAEKMLECLTVGCMSASVRDTTKNTSEIWVEWHKEQVSKRKTEEVMSAPIGFNVVRFNYTTSFVHIRKQACADQEDDSDGGTLFIPPSYGEFEEHNSTFSHLLKYLKSNEKNVASFAFGSFFGKMISLPSSPFWVTYIDGQMCVDEVPILMLKKTFCSIFEPRSYLYLHFHSWVIASALQQHQKEMVTFPLPLFRLLSSQIRGPGCSMNQVPLHRNISATQYSNVHGEARESVRRSLAHAKSDEI